MDFTSIRASLETAMGSTLPAVIAAIAVLVVGWLVALIVRAGVSRSLHAVKINERVQTSTGSQVDAVGVDRARGLAGVVRLTIIGLVLAMGLRAMGVADDIVNLAFGLTLGAIAVAFPLSFGLGGRQAAGEQMTRWLKHLRSEGSDLGGNRQ